MPRRTQTSSTRPRYDNPEKAPRLGAQERRAVRLLVHAAARAKPGYRDPAEPESVERKKRARRAAP